MCQIRFSSSRNNELINITGKIEAAVAGSGIKDGTNRDSPDCAFRSSRNCVLNSLSSLVPKTAGYAHEHGTHGHGAAHVLSAILGPSRSIPLSNGKLQLGAWQSICFCELDGPRSDRKIYVQVVGK
ncbi:YjbQ family protein [Candidatus Woesearchaeota archaeon]|nr:YjbQ family protein [Candidatus Woesearchaeota archaeon]